MIEIAEAGQPHYEVLIAWLFAVPLFYYCLSFYFGLARGAVRLLARVVSGQAAASPTRVAEYGHAPLALPDEIGSF